MTQQREGFQSRMGFVLAAAGAAVGLGNIWGFPTQAANNGGGAFLFVYFIVVFLLALPALFTELYIGHQAQANPVKALAQATPREPLLGATAGYIGLFGAITMLSFYCIVAGWMIAHALAPIAQASGFSELGLALQADSGWRNWLFTPIVIVLTGLIVLKGVKSGIELWSRRLMPALLVLLVALIAYVATLPGAAEGFRQYLVPDFSKVTEPKLIVSAMGQAFFSLSLGAGCMICYGSYLDKSAQVGRLALSVALFDTVVAFLAGLLIVPALYVASESGISVFQNGHLIGEGQLIFAILPQLFAQMGVVGLVVAFAFFALMSIAAITSTISATEIPVAFLTENGKSRRDATLWVSGVVLLASSLIVANFDWLFGLVIHVFTTYQLPLMGLFYFIAIGWLWTRSNPLRDDPRPAIRLLYGYLKYVCPVLMLLVFISVIS